MNALPLHRTRSTAPVRPGPGEEELDLPALLELFSLDEPTAAHVRTSPGSCVARLRGHLHEWSRRAASWGAVGEVPGAAGLLAASGHGSSATTKGTVQ